jgi:hypothetical protein
MLTEVFSLGSCFYNQNTSGDICREWNPAPPPYDPAAEAQLIRMMPEGVPPILLFRTFVKNLAMTDAIVGWGGYELSDRLSLSLRDREILGALRSRDSRPHDAVRLVPRHQLRGKRRTSVPRGPSPPLRRLPLCGPRARRDSANAGHSVERIKPPARKVPLSWETES